MTKTITKSAKVAASKKVAVNPDAIKISKGTSNGNSTFVQSNAGKSLTIPTTRWVGDIRKLSAIGASFAALEAAWAKANTTKLAKGVDGRNSPQAAKAVADNAAKAKGAAKAAPAAKTAPKASKAKESRTAVSVAHDRAYKVVNKAHGARDGSKRALQLAIVFKYTSTAKAREAGAESCDFRYAADKGFIKFA